MVCEILLTPAFAYLWMLKVFFWYTLSFWIALLCVTILAVFLRCFFGISLSFLRVIFRELARFSTSPKTLGVTVLFLVKTIECLAGYRNYLMPTTSTDIDYNSYYVSPGKCSSIVGCFGIVYVTLRAYLRRGRSVVTTHFQAFNSSDLVCSDMIVQSRMQSRELMLTLCFGTFPAMADLPPSLSVRDLTTVTNVDDASTGLAGTAASVGTDNGKATRRGAALIERIASVIGTIVVGLKIFKLACSVCQNNDGCEMPAGLCAVDEWRGIVPIPQTGDGIEELLGKAGDLVLLIQFAIVFAIASSVGAISEAPKQQLSVHARWAVGWDIFCGGGKNKLNTKRLVSDVNALLTHLNKMLWDKQPVSAFASKPTSRWTFSRPVLSPSAVAASPVTSPRSPLPGVEEDEELDGTGDEQYESSSGAKEDDPSDEGRRRGMCARLCCSGGSKAVASCSMSANEKGKGLYDRVRVRPTKCECTFTELFLTSFRLIERSTLKSVNCFQPSQTRVTAFVIKPLRGTFETYEAAVRTSNATICLATGNGALSFQLRAGTSQKRFIRHFDTILANSSEKSKTNGSLAGPVASVSQSNSEASQGSASLLVPSHVADYGYDVGCKVKVSLKEDEQNVLLKKNLIVSTRWQSEKTQATLTTRRLIVTKELTPRFLRFLRVRTVAQVLHENVKSVRVQEHQEKNGFGDVWWFRRPQTVSFKFNTAGVGMSGYLKAFSMSNKYKPSDDDRGKADLQDADGMSLCEFREKLDTFYATRKKHN
jgi:hypothetical protein